jgi:hypothetical protein
MTTLILNNMTTTTIFRKNTMDCFGLLRKLAVLAMTAVLLLTATAPAFAQLQVCANQGFSLVSAEPASGIEPITYEWYENSIPISNSSTASISIPAGKAEAGMYEYVRVARNAACELSSNTYTVEVVAIPIIVRSGGDASQTVTMSMAVSPITYTASNATSIFLSSGSLPPGVSGFPSGASFTISGTPSTTGTYNYSVTASNAQGCTSAPSAGTITVRPLTTPPCAASTQTWSIGSQTWSDRIVCAPSECASTSTFSNDYFTTVAQYMAHTNGRYYYNWPCAKAASHTLCPEPWRVPLLTDFNTLLANTNSEYMSSNWGYGGAIIPSGLISSDTVGEYWSTSECEEWGEYGGCVFRYGATFTAISMYYSSIGEQIRCVK